MTALADSLLKHAHLIDEYLNFKTFTNKGLVEWYLPLAESITDDGAVPYLMGTTKRYRASPLSSTITWLDAEGLLPVDVLDKMQDALLFLHENNVTNDVDQANLSKLPEDSDGWSLGEGVSVWSTSLAIIAILDLRGNGLTKTNKFKRAVLWLANQRNIINKGWGYQLSDNCSVNPIMTSLALRALSLVISPKNKIAFNFSADEHRIIFGAISNGFDYLKENCIFEKNMCYWSFNQIPHCAATTWVLLALKQMTELTESSIVTFKEFFEDVLGGGIRFIISKIPPKAIKWCDEQIVYEGGAKYNKQKNYFSFSATLIPQLFQLGISPYHPKIVNQIKWLVSNPSEWKISGYDRNTVCAFTYAMVLSVLASWSKRVGSELSSMLIDVPKSRIEKIRLTIYGYSNNSCFPMQVVLKKRIFIGSIFICIIFMLFVFGQNINDIIRNLASIIADKWHNSSDDRHTILINVIAGFIYATMVGILGLIYKLISKSFRRKKR